VPRLLLRQRAEEASPGLDTQLDDANQDNAQRQRQRQKPGE
jgi:hypothetical protein